MKLTPKAVEDLVFTTKSHLSPGMELQIITDDLEIRFVKKTTIFYQNSPAHTDDT